MMISEDDARLTLELPDRYVIEPLFDFWNRTPYERRSAKHVAESFCYASNNNHERLDIPQITALLARAKSEHV